MENILTGFSIYLRIPIMLPKPDIHVSQTQLQPHVSIHKNQVPSH